jgi:hypothetical protein
MWFRQETQKMLWKESMNKKESQELTNDMLIADALLQLRTLRDLLIAKGVFTQAEFTDVLDDIAKKVAKSVLQKAHVKGNLDDLINSLQNPGDKKDKN